MEYNSFPFKAVIFDMDGTLIASTEADYLAWKKTFEDNGRELTYEDYFPLLGIKSADVVEKELKLEGEKVDKALAKKLEYFEEIVATKGIDPIPFAEDLLKRLRKMPIKIALATSSRKMKMQMVMTKLDFLKYFDVLVTGEEVHHGKPSPAIYFLAAEKLGLKPEDCVVVEDAANGVIAAKDAGMKCIAITTTHAKAQLHRADVIIDSFENLNIQQLFAKQEIEDRR